MQVDMYLIEICHPNEMLLSKWTCVDRVSQIEETMDHLQSPSFGCEETTLARITYEGEVMSCWILSKGLCVDVSKSSITNKLLVIFGQDLFEYWMNLASPENILYHLRFLTPHRRYVKYMVDFVLPWTDHLPRYYAKTKDAVRLMQDYASGKDTLLALQFSLKQIESELNSAYKFIESRRRHYDVVNAISYLVRSITKNDSVSTFCSCMTYLYCQDMKIGQKMVCDELRNIIPFHEIVDGIVNDAILD